MLKSGKKQVRLDSGVGIKPISITGTKRLVRVAIQHALGKQTEVRGLWSTRATSRNSPKVPFGNWGYEVATEEFRAQVVTEREKLDHRQ